jgi:hypothetical protein
MGTSRAVWGRGDRQGRQRLRGRAAGMGPGPPHVGARQAASCQAFTAPRKQPRFLLLHQPLAAAHGALPAVDAPAYLRHPLQEPARLNSRRRRSALLAGITLGLRCRRARIACLNVPVPSEWPRLPIATVEGDLSRPPARHRRPTARKEGPFELCGVERGDLLFLNGVMRRGSGLGPPRGPRAVGAVRMARLDRRKPALTLV